MGPPRHDRGAVPRLGRDPWRPNQVRIKWSEVETGLWRAVCECGSEEFHEPADGRGRLDPYDPSTFRPAGQASTATREILRSSGSS